MTEKVILTKRQAKFIEDHRKARHEDSEIAYKIARVGWGFKPMLAEGTEEDYNSKDGWTFENGEKMKMLTALINGYETKTDETWVLTADVSVKAELTPVFYQGLYWIPCDRVSTAMKFETEEEANQYKKENKLSLDYHTLKIK